MTFLEEHDRTVHLQLQPVSVRRIGNPERDRHRLNDSKTDASGRIWAGSKDDTDQIASGALYRLDPDFTWSRPLPERDRGTSRILSRNGAVIWEKPFLSGEETMSHSIRNLEHHRFKYSFFRRPGDFHVHFFGTATLSFAEGIRAQPGDVVEIEAERFLLPLRNVLAASQVEEFCIRWL